MRSSVASVTPHDIGSDLNGTSWCAQAALVSSINTKPTIDHVNNNQYKTRQMSIKVLRIQSPSLSRLSALFANGTNVRDIFALRFDLLFPGKKQASEQMSNKRESTIEAHTAIADIMSNTFACCIN
jgi:hypothetical protein